MKRLNILGILIGICILLVSGCQPASNTDNTVIDEATEEPIIKEENPIETDKEESTPAETLVEEKENMNELGKDNPEETVTDNPVDTDNNTSAVENITVDDGTYKIQENLLLDECEELSENTKIQCYYKQAKATENIILCRQARTYEMDCALVADINQANPIEEVEFLCKNLDNEYDIGKCFFYMAVGRESEQLCNQALSYKDQCLNRI